MKGFREISVCSAGECRLDCVGGTTVCGRSCVDTAVDPENCGGCGKDCDAGYVCSNGVCALSCQSGLVECGSTCVNPNTDRNYCGATEGCGDSAGDAGEVCAAGEICVGGTCSLSCPASLVACGGSCIDPNSNPDYCGASGECSGANAGVACGAGQACLAGQCEDLVTIFANCREYGGAIWCAYDNLADNRSCTEICDRAGLSLSSDTNVVQVIDTNAECTALFAAFDIAAPYPLVYNLNEVCAAIVNGSYYCSSDPTCIIEMPYHPGQANIQMVCPCE